MSDKESGALLASMPPVVSAILKDLPAKQLNACAQVNRLWHTIAQSIKKQRKKAISWFLFIDDDEDKCESIFLNHLNNLQSEPSFTLIFYTKALMVQWEKYFSRSSRKRKQSDTDSASADRTNLDTIKDPVACHLLKHLPEDCDVGFCTANGVTGTRTDNSCTYEVERAPALVAICFPSLPGVEMHRFEMSGISYSDDFDVNEHTGIPEGKTVKCLLVFLHDRTYSHRGICSNAIIRHFIKKQKREIAVGGAYINHMYFPKYKQRRRNQSYGVAFTGDNVEAASVIIGPQIDTKERVEAELKEFMKTDFLRNRCIAFMFTCVARGTSLFGARDIESSVFRELYPSVPLFGVFGNGEIGIDYIPNSGPSEKELSSWYHSYCTVFVMLALKGQ